MAPLTGADSLLTQSIGAVSHQKFNHKEKLQSEKQAPEFLQSTAYIKIDSKQGGILRYDKNNSSNI